MSSNHLEILARRRFLPLFVTQFLGALNDNVFKNALVILVAFREKNGKNRRCCSKLKTLKEPSWRR